MVLIVAVSAVLMGTQLALGGTVSPNVSLSSVTFKNGTIDVRFRMCLSVGPKAVVLTREIRRFGGRMVASASSGDPLGVDMTGVAAYSCVSNYMESWLVKKSLLGHGTYA